MVGRTVHQYQFIEKLGSGGMGEIFKAQDTKLNRFVAIKILPADKSGDADRRRRFVQEAQAASALNHPNIITIHDIVSDGNIQYMVMEFVTGQTLLNLIPVGGMRVPQVLQYSTQMADALGAAHAAGIIHRDFKPANVMVTSSGLVKVLDFGLAKLTDRNPNSQFDSDATATSAPITVEGAIMGTVSYMSPEQAEGKRVDARSDIFSFGSVLYEMVTGRRAFHGDSGISTLTSVLRDDIKPMSEIALEVPPLLEVIIGRCLIKDPDGRWQSMKEVGDALTTLKRTLDSGVYDKAPVAAATVAASAIPPPLPVATAAKAGPMTTPPPVVPSAPAAKRSSAKDLIFGLVCILIVGGIAAGGWWWVTHKQPAPQPVAKVAAPSTPTPVTPPPVTTVPAPAVEPPASTTPAPTTTVPTTTAPAKPPKPKPAASTAAPSGPKPSASTTAPPGPTSPVATPPRETKPTPRKPVIETVPVVVSASLPFRITLDDDVAADASAGQAVRFTVVDGLKVGDAIVVAKGAKVTGTIFGEAGKKFLGIGKKMTFQLQQADAVDGHKLAVRAIAGGAGKSAPSRPFDTGKGSKSKELAAAKGTEYIAYTDGEQTVAVRK